MGYKCSPSAGRQNIFSLHWRRPWLCGHSANLRSQKKAKMSPAWLCREMDRIMLKLHSLGCYVRASDQDWTRGEVCFARSGPALTQDDSSTFCWKLTWSAHFLSALIGLYAFQALLLQEASSKQNSALSLVKAFCPASSAVLKKSKENLREEPSQDLPFLLKATPVLLQAWTLKHSFFKLYHSSS